MSHLAWNSLHSLVSWLVSLVHSTSFSLPEKHRQLLLRFWHHIISLKEMAQPWLQRVTFLLWGYWTVLTTVPLCCTLKNVLTASTMQVKTPHAKWKPHINDIQRGHRLKTVQVHLRWTNTNWQNVLWSDESTFQWCCQVFDTQMTHRGWQIEQV